MIFVNRLFKLEMSLEYTCETMQLLIIIRSTLLLLDKFNSEYRSIKYICIKK